MSNTINLASLSTKFSLNQTSNIDPKMKKSLDKQYRNRQERKKAAFAVSGGAVIARITTLTERLYLSIKPNYEVGQLGIFGLYLHFPDMIKGSVEQYSKSKDKDENEMAIRILHCETMLDGAMPMTEHLYQLKIERDSEYLRDWKTDTQCIASSEFSVDDSGLFELSSELYDMIYPNSTNQEKDTFFKERMSELKHLLNKRWNDVEKIAKVLQKKKTLDEDEFLDVLCA